MKKLLFILILLTVLVLESLSLAGRAQAAETVKDTVSKLKEKIASQASEVKDKIIKIQHLSGTVSKISSPSFFLKTKDGKNVEIKTNTKTKYAEKLSFNDLKVDVKVSVVKDSTNLAKLVVIQKVKPAKRRAVFGVVEAISGNNLTLHHIKQTTQKFSIVVNAETKIKVKDVENATLADVKVGDKVTAAGTVDEKGVITAKRLFVVPGKFKGTEKLSTPSSKPATSSSNY